MSFLTILPYELKFELLHYLSISDLYDFSCDVGLNQLPEFACLNNEKLWLSIWRTHYSKFELSDTYPGNEQKWKDTLKHVLDKQLRVTNANTCEIYQVYFEYGCELQLSKTKVCSHSAKLLCKSMNLIMFDYLLEQKKSLQYFTTRTEEIYFDNVSLISEIFEYIILCHRHAVEKLQFFKYILEKYQMTTEQRNKLKYYLEIFIGKCATVKDLEFFQSHYSISFDYNKLFQNALVNNNQPIINYVMKSRQSIDFTQCLLAYVDEPVLNLDVVKFLCSNGADGRADKYKAVRRALETNNVDIFKYLLDIFPVF